MIIDFKFNLIFSKIIAFLGAVNTILIVLGLLNIIPDEIMKYLNGFSFVTSPVIFGLALINYIIFTIVFLIKYNYTKNYSNVKRILGFNFIGLVPFIFYIIIIATLGFWSIFL